MDTLLSTTKLTNRELITWGYGVKMNLIFNHILMIQRGGLGNGTDPAYQTPVQAVIRIGLLTERETLAHPFDDEISAHIFRGEEIIAGANPRGCLLAVYRFLREAGCRFYVLGRKLNGSLW